MKKLLFAASCAVMMTSPALADEAFISKCEAFQAEIGADPSGCSCMAEAAASEGVADEFMSLETEADIENLSEDAQAVAASCYPEG